MIYDSNTYGYELFHKRQCNKASKLNNMNNKKPQDNKN